MDLWNKICVIQVIFSTLPFKGQLMNLTWCNDLKTQRPSEMHLWCARCHSRSRSHLLLSHRAWGKQQKENPNKHVFFGGSLAHVSPHILARATRHAPELLKISSPRLLKVSFVRSICAHLDRNFFFHEMHPVSWVKLDTIRLPTEAGNHPCGESKRATYCGYVCQTVAFVDPRCFFLLKRLLEAFCAESMMNDSRAGSDWGFWK